VLEDWCPLQPYFFLYYAGRRQVPVPLRAFIDMARAFFAEPAAEQELSAASALNKSCGDPESM